MNIAPLLTWKGIGRIGKAELKGGSWRELNIRSSKGDFKGMEGKKG